MLKWGVGKPYTVAGFLHFTGNNTINGMLIFKYC